MTETFEAVENAPSAFVSYAHEDQEFVAALINALHGEGLGVRYDKILMRVGDSLIGRISEAIVSDAFLVAVISPNSVKSEWCKKELAIAMTKGIKSKRVTVLPVKYRDPEMPPMLIDIYHADADRYDIPAVAKELADSMRRHLSGDDGAPSPSTDQDEATGGAVTGNTTDRASILDHLDEVATAVFEVFELWTRVWSSQGNIYEIANVQRPLKWALGKLPDEVKIGLPSVIALSEAEVEYFAEHGNFERGEDDLFDELHSVRRQVDQGLDVTGRWMLSGDLGSFAVNRDGNARLWEIRRGDETRRIQFFISGTVLSTDDEHLPPEVAEAKISEGRSAVMSVLAMENPPENVVALSTGISFTLPD